MFITNNSNTPLALTLRLGVIHLQPGERWHIPDVQKDEVTKLFASTSFQRLVDNGFLSMGKKDEEPVTVKTPEPPQELKDARSVEGLGAPVGTNTGGNASTLTPSGTQSLDTPLSDKANKGTKKK